jgi:hypothetical protein
VFCSPSKGTPFDVARYAVTFRLALKKAGIDKPVRPFHDQRHTSITHSAAAGLSPASLMARAGHSDFKTTQGYIDLSGEVFRADAAKVEERVFGSTPTEEVCTEVCTDLAGSDGNEVEETAPNHAGLPFLSPTVSHLQNR